MKKIFLGLSLLGTISSYAAEKCPLSIKLVNDDLIEIFGEELSWSAKRTLKRHFDLNDQDTYPRLEIANWCHIKDSCYTVASIVDVDQDANEYIVETVSASGYTFFESAIENGIEAAVEKFNGCN